MMIDPVWSRSLPGLLAMAHEHDGFRSLFMICHITPQAFLDRADSLIEKPYPSPKRRLWFNTNIPAFQFSIPNLAPHLTPETYLFITVRVGIARGSGDFVVSRE